MRLSAIRKLAAEAAENDLLDRSVAQGIVPLKGVHQSGDRAGNCLTLGDRSIGFRASQNLPVLKLGVARPSVRDGSGRGALFAADTVSQSILGLSQRG